MCRKQRQNSQKNFSDLLLIPDSFLFPIYSWYIYLIVYSVGYIADQFHNGLHLTEFIVYIPHLKLRKNYKNLIELQQTMYCRIALQICTWYSIYDVHEKSAIFWAPPPSCPHITQGFFPIFTKLASAFWLNPPTCLCGGDISMYGPVLNNQRPK